MQNNLARIKDLGFVCPGYSPSPAERKKTGKYLLLCGRNIKEGRLIQTEKDSYLDDVERDSFRRAIAQPGDIIVSMLFDKRVYW